LTDQMLDDAVSAVRECREGDRTRFPRASELVSR